MLIDATCRLALQNGLRRGEPVVAVEIVWKIESSGRYCPWSACTISCAIHQPQLVARASVHGKEAGGIGVVVADDLLAQEMEQERAQADRIGEQAEEPVGGLHPAGPRFRQLGVELGREVGAHLLAAPHGYLRRFPELHVRRPFDRGHQAVHQLLGRARARRGAAAGGRQHHHKRQERRAPHSPSTDVRYHSMSACEQARPAEGEEDAERHQLSRASRES